MKKIVMLMAAVAMTVAQSVGSFAQDPYLAVDQMPDLIKCLPAPPAFDSPEFANDMMRFAWGKRQRLDPERAAQAKADAVWNIDTLFKQMSESFGVLATEAETPEIYKLLTTALNTTDPMRVAPKAYYMRQRPFDRFNDKMLTDEEDELRGEGSYPSGHTMRGWVCTMLMAEIAPQRANEIFARGWVYGENRVVVGAHWQSDVDASRVGASIAYCALHSSEAFQEQMKKAKTEYAEKTGDTSGFRSVSVPVGQLSDRAYRLDGAPATGETRGIVISGGRKTIVK